MIESRFVTVDSLRLHYLECGSGPPVLLLHGWPTSSFLWRNILPAIGATHRAIALDLPGFGQSDKPLDASYSFRFFERILEQLLDALGLSQIGLAVHDLGGPIGLYWACQHPQRVRQLAILNTVAYAKLSWAAIAFVAGCKLPGISTFLASPPGLALAMRIGMADHSRLTPEVLDGVRAPFATAAARRALLKAGAGLHPNGLADIEQRLPIFANQIPVRLLYGTADHILPDVETTMRRLARDLPQAERIPLSHCGHFLQEDRPQEVAQHLAEFFAKAP